MDSVTSDVKVVSPPSARKIILTSFLVNLVDVLLGLIAALMTGSVTMVAQFLEGTVDLISSGLLMIGVRQSNKNPDRGHPFGHGREMFFWAMISALLMLGVTASLSIYFGLQRFLHPEPLENLFFAYLVLTISVISNGYSLSLSFKRLLGKNNNKKFLYSFFYSPLIETKTTFVLDLMGTAAAGLGLISLVSFGITGDRRLDGVGAVLIGVTLAILALLLIKSVKDLLVGRSAAPEVEENIRKSALTIPEVKNILDLRTMYIGPERLLVNLEVHLEDNLNTDQIESLTDKIKHVVQTEEPTVHHIQVELETPES